MYFLKPFWEKVANHQQRSNRIEALADGVFSIVMTLLVLDIRVPIQELNTEMQVLESLKILIPKLLTFILSFLVAGQLWLIFTNHFNYIHLSDRNEIIISIFYLLSVSLLPFSTSFLSEHLWSKLATGFYVLNLQCCLLFLTLHWQYSYHWGLVQEDLMKKIVVHRAMVRRTRTTTIAYGLATGFCFVNSYLALGVIMLIQALFTFAGVFNLITTQKKKSFVAGSVSIGNFQNQIKKRLT